jgi:hypothetical protein
MTNAMKSIEKKLATLKKAKRRYYLFSGIVFALLAFTVGILVFSLIDLFTSTANSLRLMLFSAMVFLSFVLLARLGIAPIVKRLKQLLLAHEVENAFPDLENSLITAIEYGKDVDKQQRYSTSEMVEVLVKRTEERIRPLDFFLCVNWRKLRVSGLIFGIIVVLFCAYLFIVPDSMTAMARTIKPWENITFTKIASVSGNMDKEEFSDVDIKVSLDGRLPEKSTVHIEEPGDKWRAEDMAKQDDSSRDFRFSIKNVARDFAYYVDAGDARSSLYKVRIFAVPKIEKLALRLDFPSYTELPPQEIETGAIVALRGTDVSVSAETNIEAAKASLVFADGTASQLQISGKTLTGKFPITKDDSYFIQLTDDAGRTNKNPVKYPITALKDRNPEVKIIRPNHDLQLIGTAEIPISIDAADDYGISEIGVVVNVKMQTESKQIIQKFDTRTTFSNCEYTLFLEDFLLESHDLVSFYAYAIDNDAITGPKKAVSKIYFVEILPYEEIYREKSGSGMKMMPKLDVLKKLIRVQREILVRNFSIQNELTEPLSQDVIDRIQELSALQRSNGEEAKDYSVELERELLEKQMESEIGKVQTIIAAAEEMFKAVEFLDKNSVLEAADPEQKALAYLYKALTDMEKMVSRESKEGQQQQEKIRQALELADKKTEEKTQEKLQKEQEQLAKEKEELEKLKEEQSDLNKEMQKASEQESESSSEGSKSGSESESKGKGDGKGKGEGEGKGQGEGEGKGQGEGKGKGQGSGSGSGEMSDKQADLSERAKKVASNLQNLSKEHPNLSAKAGRETEEAAKKMDSAKAALDENKIPNAHSEGKKAEDYLKNALDEMAKAENRNLQEALDRLAKDTANTARDQAELKDTAETNASDGEKLKQLSKKQDELKEKANEITDGVKKLEPQVASISKQSGESMKKAGDIMNSGNVQGEMGKASKSLNEGKPSEASPSQSKAQEQLADAARNLEDAATNLTRSEKDKLLDAIKKTKDAIEKQNALNKRVESAKEQEASSKPPFDTLKADQKDAGKDAEEAAALVKQLQEGKEFSPSLRNFAAAAKEIKDAEDGLERENITVAATSGTEAEKYLRLGLKDLKELYDKQLLDDLGEAIRQAQQIKKEQDKLVEDTASAENKEGKNRQLALKQKWIGDDLKNLQGDIHNLSENADTVSSDALERMKNADEILKSPELEKTITESRDNLENSKFSEAKDKEVVASAKIGETISELERAYKMLSTSDVSRLWEVAEKLRKAAEKSEKMKESAEKEEKVSDETKKDLKQDIEQLEQDLKDVKASQEAQAQMKKASETMETLLKPKNEAGENEKKEEKDQIKFVQAQIMAAENDVVKQLNILIKAQRIVFPKDEACPTEYEKLVQYYYKILSEF